MLKELTGSTALAEAVLHHHERYDGHGYPDELSADQIYTLSEGDPSQTGNRALIAAGTDRPGEAYRGLCPRNRCDGSVGAGMPPDPAPIQPEPSSGWPGMVVGCAAWASGPEEATPSEKATDATPANSNAPIGASTNQRVWDGFICSYLSCGDAYVRRYAHRPRIPSHALLKES